MDSRELKVKKAKTRCRMRGCLNNKATFALSLTREIDNSIILCDECAAKVYPAIQKYVESLQEQTPPANPQGEVFPCQYCDREIKGKLGLTSHEKACKENPINKSE